MAIKLQHWACPECGEDWARMECQDCDWKAQTEVVQIVSKMMQHHALHEGGGPGEEVAEC